MKNFSHLHPSAKNPFPKKTSTLKPFSNTQTINSIGKNSSMRTFNQFNAINKSSAYKKQRLSSKSIEQPFKQDDELFTLSHKKEKFAIENEEDDGQQLFKQSYRKIGMIRQNFSNHSDIDNELNQILNLIREERSKIKDTMESMKKQLEKGKYEFQMKDSQANTEEMIPCIDEKMTENQQTQTEIVGEQVKQTAKPEEVYSKLAIMLHDMGIDSKEILPPHVPPKLQAKQYKKLSEGEIIKIQKFLIKKLAEKVQK